MTPRYCRCGHTESWHAKKYPSACQFHCGEAKGMPDSACKCEVFDPAPDGTYQHPAGAR